MRLAEDYRFGGWDQLGPSSVAFALGATEKGVFGLNGEKRAGDLVRALRQRRVRRERRRLGPGHDGRRRAPVKPAAPTRDLRTAVAIQAADRQARRHGRPAAPGRAAAQDDIIAEELARASENIERRVKRREHTFTVATGPEGGEYARFGAALISGVAEAAPNVKLRQRNSQGQRRERVAAVARRSRLRDHPGRCRRRGDRRRAMSSHAGGRCRRCAPSAASFPRPSTSSFARIRRSATSRQLRGRRVAIGTPVSGTRFDAVAVLAAHGVKIDDLAEASEEGATEALARLQRGELDAVFLTGAAPIASLQQFAVTPGHAAALD